MCKKFKQFSRGNYFVLNLLQGECKDKGCNANGYTKNIKIASSVT